MAEQEQKFFNVPISKIEAAPKRSLFSQGVEFLTGIPTDPDFYRNASRQDIFMSTVPQIAIGLMGKAALTGGRLFKQLPSAMEGVIKKDPYGLASGPMDRRVFIDKLLGNTTKRAVKESDRLLKKSKEYDNWREANEIYGPYKEGDPFDRWSKFGEQFNEKYGWPNAVNNPNLIRSTLRHLYTGEPAPNTPIKSFFDAITSEIKNRVRK